MDSSVAIGVIVYLLVFRLSIVILGGVSIVLGYSLFVKGITAGGEGSEMGAKVGGMALNLKGAAPGTFFAAFGVIIVSVMMTSSPPGFEETKTTDSKTGKESSTTALRGDGDVDKQMIDAIKEVNAKVIKTTKEVAETTNVLALMYSAENKMRAALFFSEIAPRLAPHNYNYLDTRAEVLFINGKYGEAAKNMQEAVNALEQEVKDHPDGQKQEMLKVYKQKLEKYKGKAAGTSSSN